MGVLELELRTGVSHVMDGRNPTLVLWKSPELSLQSPVLAALVAIRNRPFCCCKCWHRYQFVAILDANSVPETSALVCACEHIHAGYIAGSQGTHLCSYILEIWQKGTLLGIAVHASCNLSIQEMESRRFGIQSPSLYCKPEAL